MRLAFVVSMLIDTELSIADALFDVHQSSQTNVCMCVWQHRCTECRGYECALARVVVRTTWRRRKNNRANHVFGRACKLRSGSEEIRTDDRIFVESDKWTTTLYRSINVVCGAGFGRCRP